MPSETPYPARPSRLGALCGCAGGAALASPGQLGFYPSRLPGEPAEGVEDVHFHPLERTSVRLAVSWRPASSAAKRTI